MSCGPVAENLSLTVQARNARLQQLADNEIRQLQEQELWRISLSRVVRTCPSCEPIGTGGQSFKHGCLARLDARIWFSGA